MLRTILSGTHLKIFKKLSHFSFKVEEVVAKSGSLEYLYQIQKTGIIVTQTLAEGINLLAKIVEYFLTCFCYKEITYYLNISEILVFHNISGESVDAAHFFYLFYVLQFSSINKFPSIGIKILSYSLRL